MRDDLYVSVGDTQAVPLYVVDEYGVPVDLTGATAKLYATRETAYFGQTWPMDSSPADAAELSGVTLTPDADQVTNPGKATWTPTSLTVAGTYAAQIRVVFAGGGVRHYPTQLGTRIIQVGTGLNP
jgi:hypothetical protein